MSWIRRWIRSVGTGYWSCTNGGGESWVRGIARIAADGPSRSRIG